MPWRRPCATVGSTVSRSLARIAHVFDHESDTKRKLEIRIGWIDAARRRPEIFLQRLRHFLKMTAQNERFGMVQ